jgi:hypothetical protein
MALVERAINGQFRDISISSSDQPIDYPMPDGWSIDGYPGGNSHGVVPLINSHPPGATPYHLGVYFAYGGIGGTLRTTINAKGALFLITDVWWPNRAPLDIYLNGVNVGTAGGGDSGIFIDLSDTSWPSVCELKFICVGSMALSQVLDYVSVLTEGCINFAPIWSLDIGPAMLPG